MHAEARIRDARLQPAVAREHDQAFAIRVEAARRIDAWNVDEIGKRRTALEVGELAQDAMGLVEQDNGAPGAQGFFVDVGRGSGRQNCG